MPSSSLYLELEYQNADFDRLVFAWQKVIEHHPLLQSYLNEQQTLTKTSSSAYEIKSYDLSLQPAAKIQEVEAKLRERFLAASLNTMQWPWYAIKATRYASGTVRFFMSFAPDMIDAQQIYYLLRSWLALYQNLDIELKAIPLLPTKTPTAPDYELSELYYHHLFGKMEHQTLVQLREKSVNENIALPLVLITVFREQLDQQKLDYTLYLTLANRFPLYPYMYDRATFATSLASTPLVFEEEATFKERCTALNQQLRTTAIELKNEDLIDLLAPSMPELFALFSCNLEQNLLPGPLYAKPANIIYANFALPIATIDFNCWEQGGQLLYRWSYLDVVAETNTDLPPVDIHTMQLKTPANDASAMDITFAKSKKNRALGQGICLLSGTTIKGLSNEFSQALLVEHNKLNDNAALPAPAIKENLLLSAPTNPFVLSADLTTTKTPQYNANTAAAENLDTLSNKVSFAPKNSQTVVPKILTTAFAAGIIQAGVSILGASQAHASPVTSSSSSSNNTSSAPTQTTTPAVDPATTANQTAMNGFGTAASKLTNDPKSWEQAAPPSIASTNAQAAVAAKQNPTVLKLLTMMAATAPAVLFAQQIAAMQKAPVITPDLSKAPPPSATQIATASPEQAEKTYQAYSEKRAEILAEPAKKSATAIGELNENFRGMVVAAGPALPAVSPELSEMGTHLDGLTNSLAQGDKAASTTYMEKLQKVQAQLADKMNTFNVPSESSQNPLVQKLKEISTATDQASTAASTPMATQAATQANTTAATQNLTHKVSEFETLYNGYEAKIAPNAINTPNSAQLAIAKANIKPATPNALDQATADLKAADQSNKADPRAQEIQLHLSKLEDSVNKFSSFNCADLALPDAGATITDIQKQADAVKNLTDLDALNPTAGKLTALQNSADETKQEAAALQQQADALKNNIKLPDGSLPSMDTSKLEASLAQLSANTAAVAAATQGKCPICSIAMPELPLIPSIGQMNINIPQLVNPFLLPQFLIPSSVDELLALAALDTLSADLQATVAADAARLQAVLDRAKTFDPSAKANELAAYGQELAADNLYTQNLAKMTALKDSLLATDEKFSVNCPNYQATVPNLDTGALESKQQQVQGAYQELDGMCGQLKGALANGTGGSSQATEDALTATRANLIGMVQSAPSMLPTPAIPNLQALLAAQAASVSNSLICTQHSMPGGSLGAGGGGGGPDEALVSGLKIQCPMGGSPQAVRVLPLGVKSAGGKEMFKSPIDSIPFVTVPELGPGQTCKSMLNPLVIAKVAAFQPPLGPCIPLVLAIGGATQTLVYSNLGGQKTMTKFMCAFCPGIQVAASGQEGDKHKIT
ncbi:MAG: hypothetical protein EXR81_01570 [Gammaproteobacteria bacterium]|nr:hypothetical protein [Gammaproteobacteria bacterium]